jgi:hypothetical protein
MAEPIAPDGLPARSTPISPERISPRLSFNPANSRRRAVDGGWWPQTRDAGIELPSLIAALDSWPGERVSRLAVHADDWDDIPDELPGGDRHAIRVDWFTTIPRHTITVTADRNGPIELLVIPADTLLAAASAAMDMAMTSRDRPADILTAAQQPPAQRPAA